MGCSSSKPKNTEASRAVAAKLVEASEKEEQQLVEEAAASVDALAETALRQSDMLKVKVQEFEKEAKARRASTVLARAGLETCVNDLDESREAQDIIVKAYIDKTQTANQERLLNDETLDKKLEELALSTEKINESMNNFLEKDALALVEKYETSMKESFRQTNQLREIISGNQELLKLIAEEIERENQLVNSLIHQGRLDRNKESKAQFENSEDCQAELTMLRQANAELQKQYTDALQRQRHKKRRPKKDDNEIVVRQSGCLRLSSVGSDVDRFLDSTAHNLAVCCRSFRSDQPHQYLNPIQDSNLCNSCHCGMGARHNKRRCEICRVIDVSDATLMP